jgi:hypothetical protein
MDVKQLTEMRDPVQDKLGTIIPFSTLDPPLPIEFPCAFVLAVEHNKLISSRCRLAFHGDDQALRHVVRGIPRDLHGWVFSASYTQCRLI